MTGVGSLSAGGAATRAYVFRAAWTTLDDAGWSVTAGDDALTPGTAAALPAVSRHRRGACTPRHAPAADGGRPRDGLRVSPAPPGLSRNGCRRAWRPPRRAVSRCQAFAARPLPPPDTQAAIRLKRDLEPDWPEPAMPELSLRKPYRRRRAGLS